MSIDQITYIQLSENFVWLMPFTKYSTYNFRTIWIDVFLAG